MEIAIVDVIVDNFISKLKLKKSIKLLIDFFVLKSLRNKQKQDNITERLQ